MDAPAPDPIEDALAMADAPHCPACFGEKENCARCLAEKVLAAEVRKLRVFVVKAEDKADHASREWNREWDALPDVEDKWRKEAINFFRGYEKDGRTFAAYGVALVRCLLRAEKKLESLGVKP